MRLARYILSLVAVAMLTGCQPPDKDVVVVLRHGQLFVDFPWSFWRMIGRQDRTWCVEGVDLYDQRGLHWQLTKENFEKQCVHVTMPIRIGGELVGFTSKGRPQLRHDTRYGVAIRGIGDGRVDFELETGKNRLLNETEWGRLIKPPCDTWFGVSCGADQLINSAAEAPAAAATNATRL
jgi:hypothetical protein